MKYGTLCPGVPLPCPNVMATDQARATRMALWIVSCAGTEPRGQLGTFKLSSEGCSCLRKEERVLLEFYLPRWGGVVWTGSWSGACTVSNKDVLFLGRLWKVLSSSRFLGSGGLQCSCLGKGTRFSPKEWHYQIVKSFVDPGKVVSGFLGTYWKVWMPDTLLWKLQDLGA